MMKTWFFGAMCAVVMISAGARDAAAQPKPAGDAKTKGVQPKPADSKSGGGKDAVPAEGEIGNDLEVAKSTFMAAQRLFSQEKFDEALPLFQQAFEISKSPNASIMVGNCLVMMGRSAEAYEALSSAMADAAKLAESEERYVPTRDAAAAQLAALEPKVAKVVVAFADPKSTRTVSVNGTEIAAARIGKVIAVLPGQVVVTALKPGLEKTPITRTIEIAAGETKTVVFGSRLEDSEPKDESWSLDASTLLNVRTFGYVSVGVGLTGIGLLAGAGILATEDLSTLEQECSGQRCVDERHVGIAARGRTLASLANVGLGVGIAGLLLGGGLITFSILADKKTPNVEAKPAEAAFSVSPGLGSIALQGVF